MHTNKITIFSGIFLASYLIFGGENESRLKQKILFAYQYYMVSKGFYSINPEAEAKYSLKPCLRPPQNTEPFFLHHLFWWERDRRNYGILNAYALKHNLGPNIPFPSELLRVEGVPLSDNFVDFYENYIQRIHLHSDWHYNTHTCQCFRGDERVIERVLQDTSKDKNILFLGFDATTPTEGSDIFFDTPLYRHSLFWSDFKEEATSTHNCIKSCFCQSQALLDMGLKNFFDYIIIGGQTVEYLNSETWRNLCHFLKEGGCIIYPEANWLYWGGEILNHLFNLSSNDTYEFELRRYDNQNDPIFSEIKALTQFNDKPSHGSFCYGDPTQFRAFYSHKKIVPGYKKLDCSRRNL